MKYNDEYDDDLDDFDLDNDNNFDIEKALQKAINSDSNNGDNEEIDLMDEEGVKDYSLNYVKSVKTASHIEDSVVPDGITKIRIVGLLLDGVTLAYRIKTDKGNFDISLEKFREYGIPGFKVEKVIHLGRVNGLLMSKSERQTGKLVPDISNNAVDCDKIIKLLFSIEVNG